MKVTVLITLFIGSFLLSFLSFQLSQVKSAETSVEMNQQVENETQKSSKKSEQKEATEKALNQISLEELALLVYENRFHDKPWLSAKVSHSLNQFEYSQLLGSYEYLSDSQIAGRYQLMNFIVLDMAERSSTDTLNFLLERPRDRITSRHFNQVFKNASEENASDIGEWLLSQNYYAVIEGRNIALDSVFAKIAKKSPEKAQSYLPRAHIQLKQHIILGLIASFNEYQQFESLLNYVTVNEHAVFKQLVANGMATRYPEQTAKLLFHSSKQEYAAYVYSSVFVAKAQNDFNEAADWYLENSSDDLKKIFSTIFYQGRNNYNSQIALAWAENLPIEQRSVAIGELLIRLSEVDTEFAMMHLEKVQDKTQRYRINSGLFYAIQSKAPEQLDKFIADSEFSERLRKRLAPTEMFLQ